jgi:hypothetical protein
MKALLAGCRIRFSVVVALLITCLSLSPASVFGGDLEGHQHPRYKEIKERLARGWNTWNTRSVLSHSLLPEGFGLNLAFKQVAWLDEGYLPEALISIMSFVESGDMPAPEAPIPRGQ